MFFVFKNTNGCFLPWFWMYYYTLANKGWEGYIGVTLSVGQLLVACWSLVCPHNYIITKNCEAKYFHIFYAIKRNLMCVLHMIHKLCATKFSCPVLHTLQSYLPLVCKQQLDDNGQFHNCQSWSFITLHGQF